MIMSAISSVTPTTIAATTNASATATASSNSSEQQLLTIDNHQFNQQIDSHQYHHHLNHQQQQIQINQFSEQAQPANHQPSIHSSDLSLQTHHGHKFDDDNMDINNIDENMTVPHPSLHQTISTSTQVLCQPVHNLPNDAQMHRHPQMRHTQQLHQQPLSHQDQRHLHHHHQQHQQQQQQQHQHQQQQQHLYALNQQDLQSYQHQFLQSQQYSNNNVRQRDQEREYYEFKQNSYNQIHTTMMEELEILAQDAIEVDKIVELNRDVYQDFVIQLQYRHKIMSQIANLESQAQSTTAKKAELFSFESQLKQKANELSGIRNQLLSTQFKIFNRLTTLQNHVLNEHLPTWTRNQQHSNNGAKVESFTLDQIQKWIEKLVDVNWRLKLQIKGFQVTLADKPILPFDNAQLDQFLNCINRSLENLILNSLVVEKQPPQVMKTNTRFSSTVRFLCGPKLNVQMLNPPVKAVILSENNARSIIQRHKEMIQTSWDYLDCQQQSSDGQNLTVISQPTNYASMSGQSGLIPSSSISPVANQVGSPSLQPQQLFQTHPQQFAVQQQQQSSSQFSQHTQQAAENCPMDYKSSQKILDLNDFVPSGEILNNIVSLELQEATGQVLSHFRSMQLKKIKRTEKKGTESVMDEKFVVFFHTEFRFAETGIRTGGYDMSFHLMAFSLPVVVIVHGNQEPHAWATITWHNAFARPDGLLYQVPDKVTWRELGHVLSEKFRSCAGRGLSKQNLEYLASKIYKGYKGDDDVLISWNQFVKDQLADRSFTFWEWFHSILKLTKEHLKELWEAEKIYGFIGKKGCMELLLGSSHQEVGTFLLRYSETELGGITIAWVSNTSEHSDNNDCVQISRRLSPTNSSPNVLMHLQPFVSSDLRTRSLADRIRDLRDLVYLYPNISKDQAFKAYYTPLNSTSLLANGYVRPMLIQALATDYPKSSARANIMDCNTATPSTPNSISQSSPDTIYQDNTLANENDTNFSPYNSLAGDANTTYR